MADYALFIGWGRVLPGREEMALKLFGEATEYYGKLQQRGILESFEPVVLEPHGGDLDGFFILKGDAQKLNQLRSDDDEFMSLTARAQTMLEDVGVVGAAVGNGVMRQIGIFERAIRALEPVGAGR